MYSSQRVQLAGGLRPDFKAHYDSFFVRTVAMTGKAGIAKHSGYHHCRAGRSLSQSAATGFGTSLHRTEVDQIIAINRSIATSRKSGVSVHEAVRSTVPDALWDRVGEHAARLENLLF